MEYFNNPYDPYGNDMPENYEDPALVYNKKTDINSKIELELLKEDLKKNKQRIQQLEIQNQIIKQRNQEELSKNREESSKNREDEKNDSLFDVSNNRVLMLMIFLLVIFCLMQQHSYKSQIKDLSMMFLQNINNAKLNTGENRMLNDNRPIDSTTGLQTQVAMTTS
jgi:Fe2+ transport system protein B